MPTVTDGDGKKRHVCDEDCDRECARCAGMFNVHGMWQIGLRTWVEPPAGAGGLLCDDCADFFVSALHTGRH